MSDLKTLKQHKKSKLTRSDRLASFLTRKVGSMTTLAIIATFLITWVVLNELILKKSAFDPYPFLFLLTVINFVQLLLMPLIMIGQNVQGKHSEKRAERTYHNGLASYQHLELILKKLSDQELEQAKILQKLAFQQNVIEAEITMKRAQEKK